MTMTINEARECLRELADERLDGPVTIEMLEWETGNFNMTAFHTIGATVDVHKMTGRNSKGHPFYRERVQYKSEDDTLVHEVVRRYSEETGFRVMWRESIDTLK